MSRERVWIAPAHADNAELRALIQAAHPGAEIFPRTLWKPAKAPASARYRTELTEIGEQYVIPGCEKRAPAVKGAQLDLWKDGK